MPRAPRIAFAGTPAFAVPTLERLAASGVDIVGVLTQPDRPSGRGRRLSVSPVKASALALKLPLLQPQTLRDTAPVSWLTEREPDALVVAAYGLLLPEAILSLPAAGCINVHASLLPRWRGASPIQSAILHGDTQTGVSIMQMEAGLDTGPVYSSDSTPIGPDETAAELHDRLATLGADCLCRVLPEILSGALAPVPQNDAAASHAPRISKADAAIDWQRSAADIHSQIRAFNAWPVAETLLDGQRLRCWESRLIPESPPQSVRPGEVVGVTDSGLVVQTGDGAIALTKLQLPGRRQMAGPELARGIAGGAIGKTLGE